MTMESTRTISARRSQHSAPVQLLNMDAVLRDGRRGGGGGGGAAAAASSDATVDTTVIARSVGSVVGAKKNAFLRSLTLRVSDDDEDYDYDDYNYNYNYSHPDGNLAPPLPPPPPPPPQWDLSFADPLSAHKILRAEPSSFVLAKMVRSVGNRISDNIINGGRQNNKKKKNSNNSVTIASIGGMAGLSRIATGDVVIRINGKKIGPSYSAKRCSDLVDRVRSGATGNGYLSIQTGNENGIDTVLEATIVKPHPGATAGELGLEVWWWKGLCVRSIRPESPLCHSGLRIDDELESINDISLLHNDGVSAKNFDRIFAELPCEVTIVVKRSKHRYNGGFD